MFELGITEVEADGPAANRAGRRSAAPPGPSWRSFRVFQVGVLLDDRSGHRDLAARAAGAVDEPASARNARSGASSNEPPTSIPATSVT